VERLGLNRVGTVFLHFREAPVTAPVLEADQHQTHPKRNHDHHALKAKMLVLLVRETNASYKHDDQQDRYENYAAGRISRDQSQQGSNMAFSSENKYRYAFDNRIEEFLIPA